MKKTNYMDELITKHTAIMDKYDAKKRVAFCVDEWGAWYDVEPGTNPGFLYQQNTLRDAILCAATINIFHKHADRVRLANIAQMVNVLQSIVLTKDDKILLTPTYHIYDMYKVHQDAANLPVEILCPNYTFGTESVPALSVSASKDKQGAVHVSIVNMDPKNDIETSCNLVGVVGKVVTGQILTAGDVKAFNTFEQPNNVVLAAFNGAKLDKGVLKLKVPAKSVITVEIK
jgi:alpha-N-arabinofuranosidase